MRDEAHLARGAAWSGTLVQDVRFTARSLRRQPSVTITAVLTLALALGAATAVFAVVNSVLLRPLPYPAPDRLVRLENLSRFTLSTYLDWTQHTQTLDAMETFRRGGAFIDGDPAQLLTLVHATPGLFDLAGATPVLGRLLDDRDMQAGADPVVVLAHETWTSRFGSDPAIVGRSIRLAQPGPLRGEGGVFVRDVTVTPHRVIGVAAPIRGPLFDTLTVRIARRRPSYRDTPVHAFVPWFAERDPRSGQLVLPMVTEIAARMRDGVALAQAQVELNAFAATLASPNGDVPRPAMASVYDEAVADVRPTLLALLGATGLILLIAVSNIANILLARASTRQGELAVRAALGATRGRLTRLLLTESVALAALGGLGGVALGSAAVRILQTRSLDWIPRHQEIAIGSTVLAVGALAALVAGVLFGLPAVLPFRRRPRAAIQTARASEADRARLRSGLVVTQVALALILLTGAGLMIRSVMALHRVPVGIDPAHLLTFRIGGFEDQFVGPAQDGPITDARLQRYREALDHVRTVPGVRGAVLVSQAPLESLLLGVWTDVLTGAAQGQRHRPDTIAVSESFFELVGSVPVAGRLFVPSDMAQADRVVVVDALLADALWPGEPAVGQRLRVNGIESDVIGVVEPIRYVGLAAEMRPTLFHLFGRSGRNMFGSTVLVRHDGDPDPILAAIRSRLRAADESLQPAAAQTLAAVADRQLREPHLYLTLLGLLGALALAVAAIGVYGVVSHAVARRTGEIGIRLALGARHLDIVFLFCRQVLGLVAIGLAAGLVGALWLARAIEGLLFRTGPADPVAIGSMSALLAATAIAATVFAMRRALRIDPARTLTSE